MKTLKEAKEPSVHIKLVNYNETLRGHYSQKFMSLLLLGFLKRTQLEDAQNKPF